MYKTKIVTISSDKHTVEIGVLYIGNRSYEGEPYKVMKRVKGDVSIHYADLCPRATSILVALFGVVTFFQPSTQPSL